MNDQTEETEATTAGTSVISVADGNAMVQDKRGRVIVVTKLTAIGFYDLSKALGDSAMNPATADLASMAASVRKIDTTNYAAPKKEDDIRFVLQSLDFDGLEAVAEGLKALNVAPEREIETAKN